MRKCTYPLLLATSGLMGLTWFCTQASIIGFAAIAFLLAAEVVFYLEFRNAP